MVVVVTAPWAGPARPAPTVLRELGRRWDAAVQVLLVEDPSEDLLEQWSIHALPTWLRFLPGPEQAAESDTPSLILPEIAGVEIGGDSVTLPGPWRLVHRRTGAQPKHVIDAEFGPQV